MIAKLKNENKYVPLSEVSEGMEIEPQLYLIVPEEVKPALIYFPRINGFQEIFELINTLYENIFKTNELDVLLKVNNSTFQKIYSLNGLNI
jgi:hypothetical protein